MPGPGRGSDVSAIKPPLLSWRGVVLSLICAVLLSWPMLFTSVPLGYFDTFAYVDTGDGAWKLLLDKLAGSQAQPVAAGPADPSTAVTVGGEPDPAGKPQNFRSITYSVYLYATSQTPLRLFLATVLQTAATLLLLFAFATRASGMPRVKVAAAALFMGAVTTLPWFASYAMPDILAAAVVLYYALLIDRLERLALGWRLVFVLLASFAVASHHGNLPLAAGLIGVVLVMRAWGRSLTVGCIVLSTVPLVIAVSINLVVSALAWNEMSIAPKRLPILLARSIDDGPAYWYLKDACPEANYTICTVLPVIPSDISTFLWSDKGVLSASREQLDKMRAEEATILWHAFLAYPLEQTRSLLGNAALQIVQVGTGELNPLLPNGGVGLGLELVNPDAEEYRIFALFDVVTKVGTALGIALLLALWLKRDLRGPEVRTITVCLFGLLGNALIFGGLSAPVDRYQSRVIWILPAFALLYWLGAHRKANP